MIIAITLAAVAGWIAGAVYTVLAMEHADRTHDALQGPHCPTCQGTGHDTTPHQEMWP